MGWAACKSSPLTSIISPAPQTSPKLSKDGLQQQPLELYLTAGEDKSRNRESQERNLSLTQPLPSCVTSEARY